MEERPCSQNCRFDQQQLAALREELAALRSCLAITGLVSAAQVEAQLHRQRFAAVSLASGFCSQARLGHTLDAGEPARAGLILAGPQGARALRATARLLRHAVDGVFAGRIPCATDSASTRLYVFGGEGDDGEELDSAEQFDFVSGSWKELPRMPSRRSASAAAVLTGELYLSGGWNDFGRSLQRYSAELGTWQDLPSMARSRAFAGAAVLGGRLYVCGGLDDGDGSSMGSAERYDPAIGENGAWEALPPLLEARSSFVAAAVAGRLLVCGGHVCRTFTAKEALSTVECLEPAGAQWEAAPPMLVQRGSHAGAIVAGALCVCGGHGPVGLHSEWQAMDSAERLEPAGGAWEPLPRMLAPRELPAAAAVAGRLYVCGGAADFDADEALRSVECLDPVRGQWERVPPMLASRFGPCAVAAGA